MQQNATADYSAPQRPSILVLRGPPCSGEGRRELGEERGWKERGTGRDGRRGKMEQGRRLAKAGVLSGNA